MPITKYPPPNGKRFRAAVCVNGKRASKTFDSHAQAKNWERAKEREFEEHDGTANLTFLELARLWVERYPKRKQIDWEAKRCEFLLSGWLGALKLNKITAVEISKWRDESLNRVQAGTVLRDWNLLSAVCALATKEMGLLKANPFSGVRRPEPPPARSRLATDDEIERLEIVTLNRPVGRVVLRMFKFAAQTGASIGELAVLEWTQIDLKTSVMTMPKFKTRPTRQIPLSNKAIALLGQPSEGQVFGITASRADATWRKLCKAAAIEDLNFHDSRHMAATWMSKKLDALELAKLLGHTDLRQLLNTYFKANAASLVSKLND